jgi:hypothetical protein
MNDIRRRAAEGDKEAIEWRAAELQRLEQGRKTMNDIRRRAAEGEEEAIEWRAAELQRLEQVRETMEDIRRRAAAGDEEARKWVKNKERGIARSRDERRDAAVEKATARVRELHSQGLLSLANGKIMGMHEGEEIPFSKHNMPSFGISARQYKAAQEEALKPLP